MYGQSVIRDFTNIGLQTPGRCFPGFPKATGARQHILAPREAVQVQMRVGDLLSIDQTSAAAPLEIIAFDRTGLGLLTALGLTPNATLDCDTFDSARFRGWVSAQGGDPDIPALSHRLPKVDEPLVLRTAQELTLWVIRPAPAHHMIDGTGSGTATICHQPLRQDVPVLPPLLGEIRDEFTVPRGTALSYRLQAGECVQIIDVEGQQCSDFMALRTDALDRGSERMIDSTATRSMVRRAYPGPGLTDKFFDQDMTPLLRVMQDTCGRHDTFGLACTARGYEERGFPGHINCSDNISGALAEYGVTPRPAWPAINFFWSTWVDPATQHILTEESHSRPGDYVVMRALQDLVCVSTACPDDIDPINGWNPTDVHVRIYRPETPIRRAVAYREKEDADMSISTESAFHKRLAPLTGHFAPARDLWTPVSYPSHGTLGEYWACREAVTVQDMSGLRKYDIIGPDAEKLLQLAMTRNIAKLPVWRGTYTLMCDQTGAVIDDGTLFRLAPDLFRWCCGSEESARALQSLASGQGYQVRIHALRAALPNLAVQGPKSRDLLRSFTFTQPHVPALDHLNWFGVTVARLNDRDGAPFMLSRSGYTGELGFEIFCSQSDAVAIWDAVAEAGEPLGLTPMGSAALEIMRIEAGLAAAGSEFAPGIDAFEAGLGFAVDLNKTEFVGKAALQRNARDPRRALRGLLLECDDTPAAGAPVFDGERQVGVVTSATRSPTLERAIAMARLSVEHTATGTHLEIGQLDGRMKRLGASVSDLPFIDPQRKRARA